MQTYCIDNESYFPPYYRDFGWIYTLKKIWVYIPNLNVTLDTRLVIGEDYGLFLHQASAFSKRISVIDLGYLDEEEIRRINASFPLGDRGFGFSIPNRLINLILMNNDLNSLDRHLDIDLNLIRGVPILNTYIHGLNTILTRDGLRRDKIFLYQQTPDGIECIRLR